jgi:hypothetical protein
MIDRNKREVENLTFNIKKLMKLIEGIFTLPITKIYAYNTFKFA